MWYEKKLDGTKIPIIVLFWKKQHNYHKFVYDDEICTVQKLSVCSLYFLGKWQVEKST